MIQTFLDSSTYIVAPVWLLYTASIIWELHTLRRCLVGIWLITLTGLIVGILKGLAP